MMELLRRKTENELALEFAGRIREALVGGAIAAAKVYNEWVKADHAPELLYRYTGLPIHTWEHIVGLAKGDIVPEAGMITQVSVRKMFTLLPLSEQKRLATEGVEVLDYKGETVKVKIATMTLTTAKQVFTDGRVRTVSEQAAWKAKQKLNSDDKERNAKTNLRYFWRGDKLVFKADTEISKAQLQELLDNW
jgi:hypothetical protein